MTSSDRKTEKAARKAAKAESSSTKATANALQRAEQHFWDSPRGQARSASFEQIKYFQIELAMSDTRSAGSIGEVRANTKRHGGQGAALTPLTGESGSENLGFNSR